MMLLKLALNMRLLQNHSRLVASELSNSSLNFTVNGFGRQKSATVYKAMSH
jgi:hypothetical protein